MILLLVALFFGNPAEASKNGDSCLALTNGDRELARKCFRHLTDFDLDYHYANACSKFSTNVENRMRCLRSGANLETFNICQQAKFSLDGTLTCLRSYPTPETMKRCKNISTQEDDQLRCIRTGRGPDQMQACVDFFRDKEEIFACLSLDLPAHETRRCGKKGKTLDCMQHALAVHEGRANDEMKELRGRELASETDPIFADEAPVVEKPKKK
jgi:hypothetical protein